MPDTNHDFVLDTFEHDPISHFKLRSPDYLRIGDLLARLRPPRVLACTATATPDVRREIAQALAAWLQPSPLVRLLGSVLRVTAGAPVADNQNSETAGPRGPVPSHYDMIYPLRTEAGPALWVGAAGSAPPCATGLLSR